MSKTPLVSILTPAYNHGHYIEQTIRSVLNQTYQDWEWVILDDGSTDNTADIIKKYKDSRIRYFSQEHAGVPQLIKTFNKALSTCNGDLIAMLDSDDYWPDYKLAIQIKSFNDPDIVLSYGESCVTNSNGRKIGYMNLPDDMSIANNDPIGSSLKILLLKRNCFIPNSTVILKKNILLKIGGFVVAEGLYQDFPTWTRLSLEGRFSAIPACLGYWRRHVASTYLNSDPELFFDAGISFLREFIHHHQKRLIEINFSYDIDRVEKDWADRKNELMIDYKHYNKAMQLMKIGAFKEAKVEFIKFIEKYPSLKNKFIHFLIDFSNIIKTDIVNPLADLKTKIAFLNLKIKP